MKIINNKKIEWNSTKSVYEHLKGIEFESKKYGDITFEVFAYHMYSTDLILVKKNNYYEVSMWDQSLSSVLPIEQRNSIVDINNYLWVDINVIKEAYENNK